MAANLITIVGETEKVAEVDSPQGKILQDLPPPVLLTKRKRNPEWNQKSQTSLEDIELALRAHKGYISRAARALNMTPEGIRKRVRNTPSLKQVLYEIREEDLDNVESKLDQQINQGNMTAIIWTLKCRGRHRGWNERPEEAPPPPPQERGRVLVINFVDPPPYPSEKKPNESVPPIPARLGD